MGNQPLGQPGGGGGTRLQVSAEQILPCGVGEPPKFGDTEALGLAL
jgi:hypothetical protein